MGNMSLEGAPSSLISPAERVGKVELGDVRVERQKLGEGGEQIVRGEGFKTGTLSKVGVWLGGGEVGDWIWGGGSLFIFEGCRPWWRETLTHHAEQKREENYRVTQKERYIAFCS